MAEQIVINWTRPMLERFKRALAAAPGDRNAVFVFDGHEFLKSYAGYLIEYLDGRLPRDSPEPKKRAR